jgi:hypothetical protein
MLRLVGLLLMCRLVRRLVCLLLRGGYVMRLRLLLSCCGVHLLLLLLRLLLRRGVHLRLGRPTTFLLVLWPGL